MRVTTQVDSVSFTIELNQVLDLLIHAMDKSKQPISKLIIECHESFVRKYFG